MYLNHHSEGWLRVISVSDDVLRWEKENKGQQNSTTSGSLPRYFLQTVSPDSVEVILSFSQFKRPMTQISTRLSNVFGVSTPWYIRWWKFSRLWVWRGHALRLVIFNLSTPKRDELVVTLDSIVKAHLEGRKSLYSVDILTQKYGVYWVGAENSEKLQEQVRAELSLLASANYLKKNDHGSFRITEAGLTTLINYKQEERRHSQNRLIQIALVLLTIVLAFGASTEINTYLDKIRANN